MKPVLTVGLVFGVIIALVATFFVSIGLGMVSYITTCGINPGFVIPAIASSLTNPAAAPSDSKSTAPQPGSLFVAFQAQPSFSSADQAEQRKNAATIVNIGEHRPEKFSDRDIAVAVATSVQEANLINLPYGDRDSLGLFQQRLQYGTYGTAEQILDPPHAINAYYDRLAGVANRDKMAMIDIAIEIQAPSISAYRATWKWDALAQEIVSIYKNTPSSNVNPCVLSAGVSGTGKAHLPLDPGYHVSGSWGSSDPTYPAELKPHKGIDLSNYAGGTSAGRPVYAALSGVVIESGIGRGCSGVNTVTILHDGGFSTGYLHMNGNDITVHVGDHVIAGQQIGRIASCGPSDGPHLHFEVNPRNDKDSWLTAIPRVSKYGSYWSDPVAVMAHFGINLTP